MTRANKKLIIYIAAIIYAVIQLFFNKNNPLPKNISITSCTGQACLTPTINISDKQTVLVIRVIDGDTIEIEGKMKIRYTGINSPEIYHDSTGKKTGEQCFANEAFLENKKMVEGKMVTLVKDISEKDKYGRLLRYVYVDPSTDSINSPQASSGQVIFVNDYLIQNGFAKIMTIKPDIKYSLEFKQKEKEAKANNLGIWKECPIKY